MVEPKDTDNLRALREELQGEKHSYIYLAQVISSSQYYILQITKFIHSLSTQP